MQPPASLSAAAVARAAAGWAGECSFSVRYSLKGASLSPNITLTLTLTLTLTFTQPP